MIHITHDISATQTMSTFDYYINNHVDVGLLGSSMKWTCRQTPTFWKNILLQAWRWKQHVLLTWWYLHISPYGITTCRTEIHIFRAMRPSDLIYIIMYYDRAVFSVFHKTKTKTVLKPIFWIITLQITVITVCESILIHSFHFQRYVILILLMTKNLHISLLPPTVWFLPYSL
jgi:hypothetical protein